jgi:CRISPR/Cas system CSM-associated protein Csm3 (group 7 of RAMP superfamily)
MNKSLYDRVVKYSIKAECSQPLHIGSGQGDRGGILIHPILGKPFVQATGIAGAFRDFFSDNEGLQKELFGTQEDDDIAGSKVRFTDGFFNQASIYTELRPRVRIDRKSGTCQTNSVNGGTGTSGQKFEMESVAAGSIFSFSIYIFEKDKSYEEQMEKALSALHNGNIQLGGQKSNGCGYISLILASKATYDMRNADDRKKWQDESKQGEDILESITNEAPTFDNRVHFALSGKTEGSILVKSVFVRDYGDDVPDAENIRNHKKEYIIPASSIKGVVRSQIEKICQYKGMDEGTVDNIFGKTGDKGEDDGVLGCVRFYDCVIGDVESNDKVPPQARIHIDKFTGGVMYQGLFSEKPAGGTLEIKVDITDDEDSNVVKKAKALVLLALRDIGIGVTPLGSGSSIGRGYIDGNVLTVKNGKDMLAEIDLKEGKITGDEAAINGCLAALQ